MAEKKPRSVSEITAHAVVVFGSEDAAVSWLAAPALALDGQRPADLLATPGGRDLVDDLLTRLEFGVFT